MLVLGRYRDSDRTLFFRCSHAARATVEGNVFDMDRIIVFLVCLLGLLPAYAGQEGGDRLSGVETIVQSGHYITDFDVSVDGKYVVTSDGESVALWDLEKQRIVKRLVLANKGVRFHPASNRYVRVLPVTDYISYGTTKSSYVYYTYDLFSGKRLTLKIEPGRLRRRSFTPYYALSMEQGVITLRSKSSGQVVGTLDGHMGTTSARIALNANDSLLVLSGLTPYVWDLKNAAYLRKIPYVDFLKQDTSLYFYSDRVIPLPKTFTKNIRNKEFQYGYRNFYDAYFTADNRLMLGGFNANITCWDVQGNLLDRIRTDGAPVFAFADNGTWRVAATYEGLNMGRVTDKRLKDCKAFNEPSGYKLLYQVSPVFRGKYFLTGGDDCHLLMGELGNPDFRKKLMNTPSQPMCYAINRTEDHALVSGEFGYLAEVPIDNPAGTVRYRTSEFRNAPVFSCIYLDNDILAAGCNDGLIGFWKRGNPLPVEVVPAHTGRIMDLKLTHDRKWLLSADDNGSVRIWDAATRAPLMSMHHMGDGDDYIFLTPDNYYKASKGVFDKVHFVEGFNVYSFEQFDLKYNRPDIVLQRLGAPAELVEVYHKAWQKRLKRMGYTEEMLSGELHAPVVEVLNRQDLPAVTADSLLTVRLEARDDKYRLSRLLVSLNGVPLLGMKGQDISGKQVSRYAWTQDIVLAAGNNRIDVSCLNEKGIESYRNRLQVYCEKPAGKPDLYIASIGVSSYRDASYNLEYAAKDASDFVRLISGKSRDSFREVHQLLLTDDQVTAGAVERLKAFFSQGRRDDVVMLFYAGHGVLDAEMDYYLGTYDMDFDNPSESGLPYAGFESVLDGIRPLRKFCFIDACHSGEVDKDDYLAESVVSIPAGDLVFRGAGIGSRKLKPNGVRRVNALLQDLFLDVRWGMGASILSSAGGMEAALEGGEWQNGLFTWCIKKGLLDNAADLNADRRITMNELAAYVRAQVTALSGGRQTPNIRQDNLLQEFVLLSY